MDSFNIREITLVWPISNIDPNILFNTIRVSEDVPFVDRRAKGYQWYKHFYPNMEVDNTYKDDNTLVITFMIPMIKGNDKRTPTRVVFDFNCGMMKAKHILTYAISVIEFVATISNTICIHISDNVKITNIELSVNITGEKPDLELPCDRGALSCER